MYYREFGSNRYTSVKHTNNRTQCNVNVMNGEIFDNYDEILEKLKIYRPIEFANIYDGVMELSRCIIDNSYLCPLNYDKDDYKTQHITYIINNIHINGEYNIFEFLRNIMVEYCLFSRNNDGYFELYLDDVILSSTFFKTISFIFNQSHEYLPDVKTYPISMNLFDYLISEYVSHTYQHIDDIYPDEIITGEKYFLDGIDIGYDDGIELSVDSRDIFNPDEMVRIYLKSLHMHD